MTFADKFRKQAVIPWKDIEIHREHLYNTGWLEEVFDGKRSIYKGSKKGYMSYYLTVDAIGMESAANGIKVSKQHLQRAKDWVTHDLGRDQVLAEKAYVQKTLKAGGIITTTYSTLEDKEVWALTPYGAELYRVFFYSLDREVGKPPTDWGQEFPKYMLKIFEFMGKISDMMNGMNANMNGKNTKDPFGMEQMSDIGNFGGDKKDDRRRRVKPKQRKYRKQPYKKKYKYKKEKPKKDDSIDFRFGNKDAKYW